MRKISINIRESIILSGKGAQKDRPQKIVNWRNQRDIRFQRFEKGEQVRRRLFTVALVGLATYWILTHRDPSDWRYPKMLLSEIPKMPFRYFV